VLAVVVAAQCPPPGGYGGVPSFETPTAGAPGTPTAPQPASPSGPSTPQPGGPSAPVPERPDVKGPATPKAAPAGGRMGPRTGGIALSFERGHTAKDRLKLDWLHPVPPKVADSGTVTSGALPLRDALALLWEDDQRPLLVLRECNLCKDGDEALLSRALNNDRTQLLSKWFRTVRLPAHVTEKTHPFFNVFQGYGFQGNWPHFFLLASPDATPMVFTGQQTQTQLWKGMQDVLAERYSKDSGKAVKEWLQVLDSYDTIDARRRQLQDQLGEVRADEGPESEKAKKLVASLAKLEEERAAAMEREKKVRDLGLRPMPKPVAAAGK
jgi:hypothetical protein